ncbi:MAG: signal peptidase I [Nanoarchaeota archaeon]|nr:signal peptidase I [Nanoarchaeota archaeon]MBU1027559.1 signal peptidase I [Nanoarchaeota archaeon]
MNNKEVLKNIKRFWKKFWFIVWKDESLRGWILSIIFLFVLIKFIFFPTLSFITGTSLPLAIVESCSMYHSGNLFSDFDSWWQKHDTKYEPFVIEKLEFQNYKFKNGFNKGDILFVIGIKPEKIKLGDVIIFNANKQNPLIHRVISIKTDSNGKKIFSTIGDNNNGQLSIEKNINEDQLIGKAIFKLAPYAGWGKLIFFESFRPESEKGFCKEN